MGEQTRGEAHAGNAQTTPVFAKVQKLASSTAGKLQLLHQLPRRAFALSHAHINITPPHGSPADETHHLSYSPAGIPADPLILPITNALLPPPYATQINKHFHDLPFSTFPMDDLARRKKRPVTYGKRATKRLSGIDEIFSSPRPEVSRPPPSTTDVIRNNGVKAQGLQTSKATSARVGVVGGKGRSRSAIFEASASSEDEQEESQAAQQLKNEARLFSKSQQNSAVFDVPSSSICDDSEPSAIQPSKPQKRKRGPAKATTLPKPKAPLEPPPAAEYMAPKGKRSRFTQLQSQLSDLRGESSNTSKLTSRAKITKATSRPTSNNAAPQKVLKVSTPPSHARPSDPPRMRVTRSQSRALSEEPSIQPRPTLPRESSIPAASQSRHRPSTADNKLKPRPAVSARPKSAPRPKENSRPLAAIVEPPSIGEEHPFVETRKATVVEVSVEASTSFYAAEPLASSPEKPSNDFAMMLPGSSDDDMAMRPMQRRKRLIDTLGTAPNYPRKKSRSLASGSDGSDTDSTSSRQFSQAMGSQPPILESQRSLIETNSRSDSQELGILALPKPMTTAQSGPKITYARQRSYLAEEPLDEMALLAQPLPALSSTSSYGAKRRLDHAKRKEVSDHDIAPSKGMMKSIHELRAAGETSRFMDDVEELLGDIETKMPLSTRRSGYQELASKMRDKSFCLKFRANSFDETLFSRLETETDDIVSFGITYIACCMLHDDRTPKTMLQLINNGAMTMLRRMLASPRDIVTIAKDRTTNMSKAAQSQIADLRAMVEKTPFCSNLPSGGALSPQLLALKALDTIVRNCRQQGNTDDFLVDGTLGTLVGIIKPFVHLSEYPKNSKIHNFKTFELCLSIMESYTIRGHGSIGAQLSKAERVTISNILQVILSWGNTKTMGPILLLALRLDINITNNHSDLCESLAESDLVTTVVSLVQSKFADLCGVLDEQNRLLAIDLLILSLGLLLNFAELSPKARSDVRTNEVSDGLTGIDALLNIFLDRMERIEEADSLEESTTNVAFGYLSVLLGELCQDDHIRYRVRARLPKSSLSSLVQSIEQFIAHHRMVDGIMNEGDDDEGDSAHYTFTKRLEGVADRLKSYA